jgi:hypothetical protein
MAKKLNEMRHTESPDVHNQSSGRITPSMLSSPTKVLPPLARRSGKVDWTEIMKRRQVSAEQAVGSSPSFYYERAFESPEQANHLRFYSKTSAEETGSTGPSPDLHRHKHKAKRRANKSYDSIGPDASVQRLAFSVSLIGRIDDEERRLVSEGAETVDRIKSEQQVWDGLYAELDTVACSQERAVAARRLARNSQKLVSRAVGLYETHTDYCTKYIRAMKDQIMTLKREVLLALQLKEALVLKSLDQERIRLEIEEMYADGEDFNFENFTNSARRLLDRGESQLTYYLMEAYKELAKDRELPNVESPNIKLGSLPRWEQEMRGKFM